MSKYRPSRASAGTHFSGLHDDGEPGDRRPDDDDLRARKKAEKKRARRARMRSR